MLTQQDISEHLDLDQSSVSRWCNDLCIDWKTTPLDEIRIAYIRRLREQAAGRAASGGLDLGKERARLAKEQADRIELQNAVTRGELAPMILIEEVLAKTASKVAGVLDAIPGMVRRRVPHLTSDSIDMIAGEIAKARNAVASMSLADIDRDGGQEDTEEDIAQ